MWRSEIDLAGMLADSGGSCGGVVVVVVVGLMDLSGSTTGNVLICGLLCWCDLCVCVFVCSHVTGDAAMLRLSAYAPPSHHSGRRVGW